MRLILTKLSAFMLAGLTLTLLAAFMLAGCDEQPKPQAEVGPPPPPPTYMGRFTLDADFHTPGGCPDLILVKDKETGAEVLFLDRNGHVAAVRIK